MFVVQPSPRPQPIRPPAPRGRWGTLALALGAGLAAALLAFLLVRGRTATTPAARPVPVVVAARDVPARTRLTNAMLRVQMVSPSARTEDAFASRTGLAGRISLQSLAGGAALTHSDLAAPGAALGLAFALPPSRRAVTVALDPADGVDLFARPGDHVDVLATDEPGSRPAEARTVLQDVALLAVGTQTTPGEAAAPTTSAGGASHVTVSVTPAQAQALVLASARGKIHLALRPVGDDAVSATPAFSAPAERGDVLPVSPRPHRRERPEPPAAPEQETEPPLAPLPPLAVSPPAPPARVVVTVIKGSQSQAVSVVP